MQSSRLWLAVAIDADEQGAAPLPAGLQHRGADGARVVVAAVRDADDEAGGGLVGFGAVDVHEHSPAVSGVGVAVEREVFDVEADEFG